MFEFIQVQSQALTRDEELRVYILAFSAGAYLLLSLFCLITRTKLGIVFCLLLSLLCGGFSYYHYSQTHHTVDQYRVSGVYVSSAQSQASVLDSTQQVYLIDLVQNPSYRLVLPTQLLSEQPPYGYQLPQLYCATSKAYTAESAQVLECQLTPWQVEPSNEVVS